MTPRKAPHGEQKQERWEAPRETTENGCGSGEGGVPCPQRHPWLLPRDARCGFLATPMPSAVGATPAVHCMSPTTVTSGPAAASRRGHVLASPHSARTLADALSSALTPRPGPPHPARPGPSNPPARATAKGVLRTGGQARHPMTEPRASPPPSQQGSAPPSLLHLCMAATGYMRRLANRNNDNGLQKPNFQKSMHSYRYLRKKQNR